MNKKRVLFYSAQESKDAYKNGLKSAYNLEEEPRNLAFGENEFEDVRVAIFLGDPPEDFLERGIPFYTLERIEELLAKTQEDKKIIRGWFQESPTLWEQLEENLQERREEPLENLNVEEKDDLSLSLSALLKLKTEGVVLRLGKKLSLGLEGREDQISYDEMIALFRSFLTLKVESFTFSKEERE